MPIQGRLRLSQNQCPVYRGMTVRVMPESVSGLLRNMHGVRCLSAREVYELTSNGAAPKTIDAVAARIGSPSGYSQSDLETGLLSHPALPETQQSAPIRIPSRVMRIWIAPWEDDRGDLNLSSYVFTEIEPRRWDIGVSAPRTVSPVLRPLQTQSDSASVGADGKRDNLSIYGETNE